MLSMNTTVYFTSATTLALDIKLSEDMKEIRLALPEMGTRHLITNC